jgi:hypothetical protein
MRRIAQHYRTHPNLRRHSKSSLARLTLSMLSILRVLPMARIAQFVLLLVFVAAVFFKAPPVQAAGTQPRAASHSAAQSKTARSSRKKASTVRRPSVRKSAKAAQHAKSKPRTAKSRSTHSSSKARRSSAAATRKRISRHSTAASRRKRAGARLEGAELTITRPQPAARAAGNVGRENGQSEDAYSAPSIKKVSATSPDTEAHTNPIPAFVAGGITAVDPLRGSFESLARQNEKTDADGLERILDDSDLKDRIAQGFLVQVPVSGALSINQSLPEERRYCRPWTATFLTDLSKSHDKRFHTPLYVSSAVRTVEYQKHLIRHNGNAAAATGDIVSPHVTGATIDIAKSRMSKSEIYWMRQRLGDLQDAGKIDVEEEFRQACFHITVYKSYIGQGPLHKKHRPIEPEIGPDDDDPADTANTADAGS